MKDPRREKLLNFRRHSTLVFHCIHLNPGSRRWACNLRERRLRADLRDHRHDVVYLEERSPSWFRHRHSAAWDLW